MSLTKLNGTFVCIFGERFIPNGPIKQQVFETSLSFFRKEVFEYP